MTKPKPKAEDLFAGGGEEGLRRPFEAAAPNPGPRKPRPHVPSGKPVKPPAPPKPLPVKPRPQPDKPRRDPKMLATVEPAAPVNLLSLIGQAIANPQIDASKLTALVDWYDKREADNAFARDFLAMAKELPEIKMDGTIDQGITRSGRQGVKAKYATYWNIHAVTSEILHRHGFTLSTRNEIRGEQTVVVLRLEHYDQRFGSSARESAQPIIRDDGAGKTVPQAWGSGEQYQLRRMVIKLLNLRSRAPIDDDKDGADPAKVAAAEAKAKEKAKPLDAAELAELRKKIESSPGINEEMVCNKYGLAKLEEMPGSVLRDAHKAIDNFVAARRG